MKCELAVALPAPGPRSLFLDEPTIGLGRLHAGHGAGLRAAHTNERFGATVLLTSHYMEDVAALCPRVMVIDKGRLIYGRQPAGAGAPGTAGQAHDPPLLAARWSGAIWTRSAR